MDRKAVVMIEGVFGFPGVWKHNRCVPLPKETVEHADGLLGSTRESDVGGSAG